MGHVDAVWGALFDGLIISSILYGIACGQYCRYYSIYNEDRRFLKSVVLAVFLIASLQQCLFIHLVWHYIIPKVNPLEGYLANWSVIVSGQMVPSDVVALFVECFFISRIWSLTQRRKTTAMLLIAAICGFSFRLAYTVKCVHYPSFLDSIVRYKWLIGTFAIMRTVTDLGIAVLMSWLLQHQTRPKIVEPRSSLVSRLFDYLLTTGLLNSIFTVIYLVLYFAMPVNAVYPVLYFVHGKLYFNSMLASLNSREPPRRRVEVRFITNSDLTP